MKYLIILILIVTINFNLNAQNQSQLDTNEQENITYVIRNVNIIPMTEDNKVIEKATVVIRNKKIQSINDSIPVNAKTIDGTDKWLIPGLIDMHVHNLADIRMSSNYPTKGATLFMDNQDFMLLYVANGVTTTFELSGRVEHFGQRNEIINGKVIGPRIALAYLVDGGDSGNTANTPNDGRQTVRLAKQQGYEFIKVYSNLNIETYKAIVDEASKQNMKVIGHIPTIFKGNTKEAFVPHFGMVAHAEEFSSQTDEYTIEVAEEFAKLAKDNNTWVMPNLSNLVYIAKQARSLDSVRNLPSFKYVHPLMQSKWIVSNQYNKGTSPERVAYFDSLVDFHISMVKALKNAGVPMVAGTDSGTSGIVWGFSLHNELELLVKAGLTEEEALISATRLPANWLEIEDKIGTVEIGKFADLVLLNANPLDNINNTRKIAGVFVNGEWVNKEWIDYMLSDLAEKNNRNKDKYDWNKRSEY
ncbi:amidohydrolase family protein [Mariniflexile sp. AS56]|uniref:amidohydrolase family protein n=1 Tax=Mariniflexile sp. AS56 TaxID=3063957 RepID=UPI0026EB6D4A|nr:amidohydrolase family protein [Mariniflexile sp. AS56]MDO7174249.1 amidohydrolase family protein [Mariniflexile sp. AS56]